MDCTDVRRRDREEMRYWRLETGDSMRPYSASLKTLFERNANPAQAGPMKKYMRDQFDYLGIKSPQFKELMKEFLAANGLPPVKELDVVLRDLWALPQREF